MPRPPVRIRLCVYCLCDRSMNPVPVICGRRVIGGRAGERMGELDAAADGEEPRLHRSGRLLHVEAESGRAPLKEHRVAQRLRRGGEDEQLGRRGKELEPPRVALFDLPGHRLFIGQPETAGEFGGAPRAWQLDEGERVPVALGDDLVAHGCIERSTDILERQRSGLALAESTDDDLGEPGEDLVAAAGTRGADDRDPLREDPAGDETQDLSRSTIQPLGIVDDAENGSILRGVREQRQRRKADEEPVRRGAGAPAEDHLQRVPLRERQPVDTIEHRAADLVEPAVGQLHLRLDADGRCDMPPGTAVRQVLEQRALANAGLAPENGHATLPGPGIGQQLVELLPLSLPADELHRIPPPRSRLASWTTILPARGSPSGCAP